MQKKIIALAIAGLASTAAFAQTNVTVYGIADLGEAFVNVKGNNTSKASVTRLDSNSSYIGFKGVEDLGNGLKAVFQFETGVNGDVGGFGAGRDTYIGLAGGFGTVAAGNLTHPLRTMGIKVELTPGAAGLGTTASVSGKILGLQTGADDRASNAVAYISPSFGGFTVTGAYINGENRGSVAAAPAVTVGGVTITPAVQGTFGLVNQRSYQLAAQFDNGPLFAGIGYHRALDTGTNGSAVVAGSEDNAAIIRAAVSYTLPSKTKLTALWDNTKVDLTNAVTGKGAGNASRNAYSLGVAQGFGKNTIGLEYGLSTSVKLGGDKLKDSKSSVATLVYAYDFSKRTTLHARVSYLNNESNINTGFYNNPVANGLTTGAGADYTGAMVGIRHAF